MPIAAACAVAEALTLIASQPGEEYDNWSADPSRGCWPYLIGITRFVMHMLLPRRTLACILPAMLLFSAPAVPQTSTATNNSVEPAAKQAPRKRAAVKSALDFTPAPWPPLEVDAIAVQPAMDGDCPVSKILEGASRHAVELAENLEKFMATELVQTANARKDGSWDRVESNTFNYMAFVNRLRKGMVTVEESRAGSGSATIPPLRAAGLAATALIFHPQLIHDFNMACEGRGTLNGKSLWMVHFAQKPEVPPRFQSIRVNNKIYDVKLKGRAWVAPDNFEIEHIDTDLLEPIPQIRLLTEHASIDYAPVKFKTGNTRIWLPQLAEFYLDVGGRRFFNHHRLSDFVVFSVDTQQEIKNPDLPK